MILLIDIGNTLTKIAFADESKEIQLNWLQSIETTNDNWTTVINEILIKNKNNINNAIISCVVPDKLSSLEKRISTIFNFLPIIINHKLIKHLPLKIDINQKKIGSDLVVLAVAGYVLFDEAIVIGLGTATTYTIIKDNSLKGIIIAPGFSNSKESLSNSASLIESFKINPYPSVLGNTTNHALSIGFGNGFNYMMNGTINAINKELNKKIKVIITGGNFLELKPFLKFDYNYQDNLVLKGLIIIYHFLKKNNKL